MTDKPKGRVIRAEAKREGDEVLVELSVAINPEVAKQIVAYIQIMKSTLPQSDKMTEGLEALSLQIQAAAEGALA